MENKYFFDAVGTLIYPSPPVYEVYQTLGNKYGSDLTQEQISEKFQQAYKTHFDNLLPSGEALEKQRWVNVIDDVFGPTSTNNPSLSAELWNHFSMPKSWAVYSDVAEMLAKLVMAGHYVGIASNFDARLVGICAVLFPQIETSRIFHSAGIGYAKPDIRFYKEIERLSDGDNANYIMIGDDHRNDIEAAEKAGWRAIHCDDVSVLLRTQS